MPYTENMKILLRYFMFVCFHDKDIEDTFKVNDGVEVKYIKRERPLLVKGAIPSILPGCPSYLSFMSTSRPSRFSHETKRNNCSQYLVFLVWKCKK